MSYTGLKQTYYKNGMHEQPTSYGQLEQEYFEINNKKEGIYKSYHYNGMHEQPTSY